MHPSRSPIDPGYFRSLLNRCVPGVFRAFPGTSVVHPGYSVGGTGYSVSSPAHSGSFPPTCFGVYRHHPGLISVAGLCLIRGSVTDMYKMTQSSRTTTDHPGYFVRGRPVPDPRKCDCGKRSAKCSANRSAIYVQQEYVQNGTKTLVAFERPLSNELLWYLIMLS